MDRNRRGNAFNLLSSRVRNGGAKAFVFVHVLIRGGHELADRGRGLGVISRYANAERQLVPKLISIHFFQVLLHSRQDNLRVGKGCFPRQDGKLVSTESRENVRIAEGFLQGIGRAMSPSRCPKESLIPLRLSTSK